MARIIKKTPFLAATLLLLASAANPAGAQGKAQLPTSCELKQFASVDLIVGENVLVPVSIEGKRGAMLLTMSSALSVVWKETTNELGLKSRRLQGPEKITYGNHKLTSYAVLKSFAIGDAQYGKAQFLLAPGAPEPMAAGGSLPVFGTLGMDVFRIVDFELDLSRRKLILYSQKHCPGDVVYWSDTYATAPLFQGGLGEFFFPVELEGQKVEATLAPDRSTTTLTVDASQRLYGFDSGSPVMKLTAPGLTLTDTTIRLMPAPEKCRLMTGGRNGAGYDESCKGVYPMQLGADIIAKLRLYFATKEMKVYFTPADAGKTP